MDWMTNTAVTGGWDANLIVWYLGSEGALKNKSWGDLTCIDVFFFQFEWV